MNARFVVAVAVVSGLVGGAIGVLTLAAKDDSTALFAAGAALAAVAVHESGRHFDPGTGAQEVVAIVVGILLLLGGALVLWRRPKQVPSS